MGAFDNSLERRSVCKIFNLTAEIRDDWNHIPFSLLLVDMPEPGRGFHRVTIKIHIHS